MPAYKIALSFIVTCSRFYILLTARRGPAAGGGREGWKYFSFVNQKYFTFSVKINRCKAEGETAEKEPHSWSGELGQQLYMRRT